MVMEPLQNNEILKYKKFMKWVSNSSIEKNHTAQKKKTVN